MFWRLLVPFLGLMLITGAAGTFLLVRDLSDRAQAALDQELASRSFDARTALHDRELYLLEAINFASNVTGMEEAITARDKGAIAELLRSVLALKPRLDLLAVTDEDGIGLVELRSGLEPTHGTRWAGTPAIDAGLRSATGKRTSGFVGVPGAPSLVVVGPVCARNDPCVARGVAIAGFSARSLAHGALARATTARPSAGAGLSLFDLRGEVLGAAGTGAPSPSSLDATVPERRTFLHPTGARSTLYIPFRVQGVRAGTLAVTIPRDPTFGSVRGAGMRMAAIVLAAMAGIVALGALLSRSILRQVKPLVSTSHALGQGDFTARARVHGDDELGQLARGVNQMAEQLQASYETLESRVAQRTEEVQRLLRERTEFFASMSHEFRTPLAVILSESDMLTDPGKRVTERYARETGRTMRASADQLLSVINEILDLARADAGRIEVELEEVRLDDVVKGLRPTLEGLAKSNDLLLAIDVPKNLSPVIADAGRLREIILNLVDNAVKYTPTGGSVEIAASQQNGSVNVSVADSGIGIPSEVGDRIFEPFFRVKGSKPLRGQASSGLGLALAKRFVEAQGGTIDFSSSEGTGSTFRVSLPAARPARARRSATRAAR